MSAESAVAKQTGFELLARQARMNRATASNWAHYASHRRRVTELILALGPQPASRACILGAGNCNDLDLLALGDAFAQVNLVDLDEQALRGGLRRQQAGHLTGIRLHGRVDVSGLAGWLGADHPRRLPDLHLRELVQDAIKPPSLAIGGPFNVVVSTTLLTQLMNAAINALGPEHPRLPELLAAIRTAHVRLLVELTAPGGSAALVTDVSSSDLCPELATVPVGALPALAERVGRHGKCFAGVDPQEIRSHFLHDPWVRSRITGLNQSKPWRWTLSRRTRYLVHAFTFRSAAPVTSQVTGRTSIERPMLS